MKIQKSKTKIQRIFTVVDYPRKLSYSALKPPKIVHRQLFTFYKNEKCSVQVVSKNTLVNYRVELLLF